MASPSKALREEAPGECRCRGLDRILNLENVLDRLVEQGMITFQDARKVLSASQSADRKENHPLVQIAERRLHRAVPPHEPITLEALTVWLAREAGMPYVRIDPLKVDVSTVTGLVSYAYAARHRILPIEANDDEVVIATAQPSVEEWQEELERILRRRIVAVISNPQDISRYLVEFYALTESVKRALGKVDSGKINTTLNLEQLIELGRAGALDANDRYVVNIVDWLLQYAFDQRASDIHLEPRREEGDVRFRIDGVLHLVYQLPGVVMGAVISRLKVLGRMDLAEKRRPQDGRVKTKTPSGEEVELRLSTMPTVFGEKLVMRIFDPQVTIRSFEELGLSSRDLARWREMVGHPYGIILVTGPTGSGKTTTLYTTLKQLASPEVNVCTVEEPIEMVEPRFNQMQVQHAIGLDFANGLRNLLRQDPDIIMVGEIRDLETAEMAVQAALTGHLVFSTLHTNDAVSAIVRLLDIGVPHYLIRATLLGVVAQRLVRTLCPACKRPGTLDDDLWQSLVAPWKLVKPEEVFLPTGCLECRETGYLGRLGIYEILTLSPNVRKLISPDTDVSLVRKQAMKEGMHTLNISGALKICQGLTTIEEVFRVAGTGNDLN
ncbi:MAG: Flp pilus assembly complex ATPase component TadA [Deltaproteobacteria bacterium]|nr:Flp pilus assembly complex ATPase component TadA [Deltaproteobacteria bacterium]